MPKYAMRTYSIADALAVIHDAPRVTDATHDQNILEVYFNDIYKLLLAKLAKFESAAEVTEIETKKLQQLLSELIHIKGLLGHKVIE